ncbi:unnamed protein product [Phaeothamnion confervicola]
MASSAVLPRSDRWKELDEFFKVPLSYPPRIACDSCKKSAVLYCPQCVYALPGSDLPRVHLPLEVHVLLEEERKRSTGLQVAVLAPDSARVLEWPEDIPIGEYGAETVVLYPSDSSVTWGALRPEELAAVRRILLLDCRWQRGRAIANSPKLAGVRHIRIEQPPEHSRFWRWHSSGPGCLSSLEACYCILKEYQLATGGGMATSAPSMPMSGSPKPPLEALLYLFVAQWQAIRSANAAANRPDPTGEEQKLRYLRQRVCPNRAVAVKRRADRGGGGGGGENIGSSAAPAQDGAVLRRSAGEDVLAEEAAASLAVAEEEALASANALATATAEDETRAAEAAPGPSADQDAALRAYVERKRLCNNVYAKEAAAATPASPVAPASSCVAEPKETAAAAAAAAAAGDAVAAFEAGHPAEATLKVDASDLAASAATVFAETAEAGDLEVPFEAKMAVARAASVPEGSSIRKKEF